MAIRTCTEEGVIYNLEPKTGGRGWQFYSMTPIISMDGERGWYRRENIRSFIDEAQAVEFALKVASFEGCKLVVYPLYGLVKTWDFSGS